MLTLLFVEFGNTVGHCAAEKAHAECFNCYVQHYGDLSILNDREETPLQTGRRSGIPIKLQKACENRLSSQSIHKPLPIVHATMPSSSSTGHSLSHSKSNWPAMGTPSLLLSDRSIGSYL